MTQPTHPEHRSNARWVRACLVLFLAMGLSFGSWLSRLPSLRDELEASTLQMSVYGLCLAAGSLAGMLVAGRFIERLGPRRLMFFTVAAQILALPGAVAILLSGLVPLGLVVLFVYGLSFSSTDIAMNVSGAGAERAYARPRLPLMHACYSIGTMLAMGVGALAETARVPLQLHLLAVVVALGAGCFAVLRWVPVDEAGLVDASTNGPASATGALVTTGAVPVVESSTGPQTLTTTTGSIPVIEGAHGGAGSSSDAPAQPTRYNPWRDPRVLLIGLITLSAGLVEGAPADWLPLALVDGRGVSNEFGAIMLGVFFGSVVAARLAGSALLTRFSRVAVLRSSLVCATIGVLVVVLVPNGAGMVLGTVLWGLGTGVCWPITISAAADDPRTAARDVAAVSAIGYTSMLLGPMAFGLLGEHIGLLPAFWVLPLFTLLALALSGATRPKGQSTRAARG